MKGFWEELALRVSAFFVWAIDHHPGKLIGTLLGFLVGLFVVILGFWKTLVIVLFVVAGVLLGKRHDDDKKLFDWIDRFF